jgi:N-acylneuraminate cytidylyltransferase
MTELLGIIVARRNSRRLPDKNIKLLCGKPLVVWTIEQALAAKSLAHVVLSSDDERALALAEGIDGLEAMSRPEHLARDETPSADVLRHVIEEIGKAFSHVVLLQPTSPLRVGADIDDTVAAGKRENAKSCISVCLLGKPAQWLMSDSGEGRLEPVFGNAENTAPADLYVPNGAVFVIETEWLMAGNDFYSAPPAYHVMPPERSVDIDEIQDFALAEALGAVQLSH